MKGAVHHQNRRDCIVVAVAASFAEPRHITDIDAGDVLDLDRHAVDLAAHDVLNVLDAAAKDEVCIAAGVDQPHAADIHRLLADIEGPGPDIDIRVAYRAHK